MADEAQLPALETTSAPADTRRRVYAKPLLTSVLSAAVPGLGQLVQGRTARGVLWLAAFAAAISVVVMLRTDSTYAGFMVSMVLMALLTISAACDAFFSPVSKARLKAPAFLIVVPFLIAIVFALLDTALLIVASGFKSFKVGSSSMEATIEKGDDIIVDLHAYSRHGPKRGDVVPPHLYFLLGDARDISLDSRSPEFGMVDRNNIKGRVLYVVNSERVGKRADLTQPTPIPTANGRFGSLWAGLRRDPTVMALVVATAAFSAEVWAQSGSTPSASSSTVTTSPADFSDDQTFALYQRVTSGMKPPKATFAPDPKFPDLPPDAEQHGLVVLLVGINTKGHVAAVRVLRSDEKAFEQSAVETVKKWKFKPAEKSGQPVPVQVTVEMKFRR